MIRFEQPQPVDSAASAGAGRAQIMTQNNSTIAGLYRSISDAYQARNQNAAQIQLQSLRNQQSGAELAYTTENQNYRHMASLDQQQAEMATKAGTAVQVADIEAQAKQIMQSREFSHADRIAMQKGKASIAVLDSMLKDGTVTPEQYVGMSKQADAGMDMYKAREANTQNQIDQERQKKAMTDAEMSARANALAASVVAKNKGAMSGPIPNERILQNITDEFNKDPAFGKLPPANQADLISAELRRTPGGVRGTWAVHPTQGIVNDYHADTTEKEEKPFDPVTAQKGAEARASLQVPEAMTTDSHGNRKVDDTSPHYAAWVAAARANFDKAETEHGQRAAGTGRRGQVGSTAPQPQAQPQPQPVNSPVAIQPFDLKKPQTPFSQQVASDLQSDTAKIDGMSLADATKSQATQALEGMANMVAKYGDVKLIPKEEQPQFQQWAQFVDPLLRPAPVNKQTQQASELLNDAAQRRLPWSEAKGRLQKLGIPADQFEQEYAAALAHSQQVNSGDAQFQRGLDKIRSIFQ